MAFAVVMTVACFAIARGVGTDYSEGRMPQYSIRDEYDERVSAGVDDEYRDDSPDGTATLDYKLDDASNAKTKAFAVDDLDKEKWQKSKLKKGRLMHENDLDIHLDKYNGDAIGPKYKPNYHLKNRRSRLNENGNDENGKTKHRKRRRNSEDNINESERIKDDLQINKLLFENEKSLEETRLVETDDEERYKDLRRTTETLARLYIDNHKQETNDDLNIGKLRHRKAKEMDYPVKAQKPRRPDGYNIRSSQPRKNNRDTYENYDEYDDYYDTKRFHTVENKLSNIHKRKKVRMAPAPPMHTRRRTPRRRLGARRSWATTERLAQFQQLLTKQKVTKKTTVATTKGTTRTTTTTATQTTVVDLDVKPRNLSIAELSRLSILKKTQKKERSSSNVTTTKKPPILLKMTEKVNTFIMVEPGSSGMPWMRAVKVTDLPERLEKVKALMRHKLVAEARNMHELTDNWDEMVCDYIDMSLLKNQSVCMKFTYVYIALLYVLCTFLKR